MDGMNEVTTTEETPVDVEETTTEVESSEENVEAAEPQETEQEKPEVDVNRIAAAARRQAENRLKERDAEIVRRFGHLKNPKTGMPIRSEQDYLDALDAQEEMAAKSELQEKGIDPALIDNLIANNPQIRQAKAVMEQAQRQNMINQVNNDVAELNKLDPSITSLETVPPDVIQYCIDRQMDSLVDAYKIVMYGQASAAIQQQAINQAKGKSHLNPVNGVAVQDNSVDIPQSELARWKEYFPDKSYEELKKMYNDEL